MEQKIKVNDPILEKLLERLSLSMGENLLKVFLFGSRAREDHSLDSDYDLLIVVKNKFSFLYEKMTDIAGEFFLEYSLLFPLAIISEERFDTDLYEPFLRNVKKDGKLVWIKN